MHVGHSNSVSNSPPESLRITFYSAFFCLMSTGICAHWAFLERSPARKGLKPEAFRPLARILNNHYGVGKFDAKSAGKSLAVIETQSITTYRVVSKKPF
jgi:hypothetical protein